MKRVKKLLLKFRLSQLSTVVTCCSLVQCILQIKKTDKNQPKNREHPLTSNGKGFFPIPTFCIQETSVHGSEKRRALTAQQDLKILFKCFRSSQETSTGVLSRRLSASKFSYIAQSCMEQLALEDQEIKTIYETILMLI